MSAPLPAPRRLQHKEEQSEHTFLRSTLRAHSHRTCAKAYRIFIATLILANVVGFVMSTDQGFNNRHGEELDALEAVSSIIFLVEYLLRLYTVPQMKRYKAMSPVEGRLHWIFTWESIIDFLAFAPFFIQLATVEELPNLTALRVLRVFRLLKSAPIVGAFDTVARVLYYNAEILCVAMLLCLVLLLATSTFLFYLRPGAEVEAIGEVADFSSIPATMYLAIMMLTGQGGPEGNLPWYTKAIVTVTACFSVAQFAIPASMLTWGFEAEAQRIIKRQREDRKQQVQRLKQGLSARPISSSSSSEESTDSEWSEYEHGIAGDETDSEEEDEDNNSSSKQPVEPRRSTKFDGLPPVIMGRAARIFSALDEDESGFIDTSELKSVISPAKPLGKDLMDVIDGNRDGRTTSEEFFTWLMKMRRENDSKVFYALLRDLEMRVYDRKRARRSLVALGVTPKASVESKGGDRSLQNSVDNIAVVLKGLQAEISSLKEWSRRMEKDMGTLTQAVQATSS